MLQVRKFSLFVGDVGVFILSFIITLLIGFGGVITPEILNQHILPFLLLYILWLIVFYIFNFYELNAVKPTIHTIGRMGGAFLTCFAIGAVFFYATPVFDITPKTNLVINIVVLGILLLGWRRVFYYIAASGFKRHTLLVGESPLSEELASTLAEYPEYGYEIQGVVYNEDELLYALKKDTYDTVIFAINTTLSPKALYTVYKKQIATMDLTEAYEEILHRIPVDFIDEAWFLRSIQSNSNRIYDLTQQFISFTVAGITLVVFSPIISIMALAIKLEDGGPILIRQKRTGRYNIPFTLYKFRSMYATDPDGQSENEKPVWAKEKDPRVTRVGNIIRKLHIDELAQLFNVVKGDISLVGPRPERPEFVEELEEKIPHYHLRHIIHPGFTGWAQIKFRYARSVMDSQEKFEYDLYYLKNRNLLMDLGIIIRTLQIIVTH